ncbi:hypothetical protein ACWGR4_29265 [Embleya sp. NPDC055664]
MAIKPNKQAIPTGTLACVVLLTVIPLLITASPCSSWCASSSARFTACSSPSGSCRRCDRAPGAQGAGDLGGCLRGVRVDRFGGAAGHTGRPGAGPARCVHGDRASAANLGIALGSYAGGLAIGTSTASSAVITGLVVALIANPIAWATGFLKPPADAETTDPAAATA